MFEYFSFPHNKVDYCSSLFETVTVMANGDVVACCYDLTWEPWYLVILWRTVFSKFGEEIKSENLETTFVPVYLWSLVPSPGGKSSVS